MSESTKAVFLSYASQDAEAATRICEALRSAGVEVWFDQNELVGGDAWDQKIRRQIKACALFVPIISANTQARTEGYFRLEWRLADQRTHLMSNDRAFIVPVVVDDTRDAGARVPESFVAVQWTRLPNGDTAPAFAERVKQLLPARVDVDLRAPSLPPAQTNAQVGRIPPRTNAPKTWLAAVAVVGLSALIVWRPWRNSATALGAPLVVKSSASAEVQALLAKINAVVDKEADGTREDWALAESMCEQAVKLEPGNASAWACYANAASGLYEFYRDRGGRAPLADAQVRAQKALSLASESVEAKFALANCYRLRGATRDEAEQILRELLQRRPDDRRTLRCLAGILRVKEGSDDLLHEAIALYDRAIAQPGSDPVALREKAAALVVLGRYAEAGDALNQSLALRNGPAAMARKINHLLVVEDDVPQACTLVEKLPGSYFLREDIAEFAVRASLWAGNGRKCLSLLDNLKDEWVHDEPKSFLIGQAMCLLGRDEPARLAWQQAIKIVERELAAGGPVVMQADEARWKALLFALLGDVDAAEKTLGTYLQFVGSGVRGEYNRAAVLAALHRPAEAIDALENVVNSRRRTSFDGRSSVLVRRAGLRHDPIWEPLRSEPRFQTLLEKMRDDPRFPRPAARSTASTPQP